MDATPLAVHGDADGGVWYVGIKDGKSVVSHWKRGMWRVYSVADGLIDDIHQSPKVTVAPELLPHIHDNTFNTPLIRTRSGDTWFVGAHDGLAAACRFDGTGWQRVLVKPEEEGSHLNLAFESADGSLWFGSTNSKAQFSGAGLFRFVEERWTRFSTQDGLAHDLITGISEWPTGVLWVGSADGLNQLQLTSQGVIVGEAQIDFPNAAPKVRYFCPADEVMWYAFLEPRRMGVARVDAHGTRYLTVKDGLPSDGVSQIFRSATGDVWFTAEEGISRYRGGFWSRWTADEHRFPRGSYSPILHEASDSTLWLDLDAPSTGPGAGEDRVVHVRPAADVAPPMTVLEEAASLLASDSAILLNWSATDLWDETATDQMHYQFRLDGGAWSAPDRMHSVRFDTLATGKHVFEARAIDAYGNTDPTPAAHEFVVELPWWLNPWFLLVATVLVSTAAAQTVRVVQGNRRLREEERRVYAAQRQLAAELERELDSARDMQMGLMPTSPPSITGLSVAGGCETANHVGGDLFQYFTSDDRIFIASADVTGHAMEAAIPVVMFSGILDRDMESEHELGERFQGLNRSLCRSLGDHKFICFTMAEIEDKSLRLASCGNPYPLHFHDGEVSELKVDGYPLGVRPDTQYDTIETQLHEGDYLVLYSDGIPETINPSEEMFGYERTIETVREACSEGICAEDLVERLIRKAREFAGDEHQADDMTCVVVKVEAEDGRE
ncbi:MAG: SpoIIE family protein phosphatase [Gemmatimonadetes bacterium]|nr:SpoIIE family protein phosphatase [Gemmatimonadota bacterium]